MTMKILKYTTSNVTTTTTAAITTNQKENMKINNVNMSTGLLKHTHTYIHTQSKR